MEAHIIPFLGQYSKKAVGKETAEFCVALCGEEMIRYKDDGRYFNPEVATHRMKHGFNDDWCKSCLEIYSRGTARER